MFFPFIEIGLRSPASANQTLFYKFSKYNYATFINLTINLASNTVTTNTANNK